MNDKLKHCQECQNFRCSILFDTPVSYCLGGIENPSKCVLRKEVRNIGNFKSNGTENTNS